MTTKPQTARPTRGDSAAVPGKRRKVRAAKKAPPQLRPPEEERPTHGLSVRFTQPELDALGVVAKREQRSKHFLARRYITEALALDASERERTLQLVLLQNPDKSKSELMDEAVAYLFARYGAAPKKRRAAGRAVRILR